MKLPLLILASCAMLALAFGTHQPVVPRAGNDTDKPTRIHRTGTAPTQSFRKRYFFIGYLAKQENGSFSNGGIDYTTRDGFPCMKIVKEELSEKYDYKTSNISILSVSEYTDQQRKVFWKGTDESISPSPSPIRDTVKPRVPAFQRMDWDSSVIDKYFFFSHYGDDTAIFKVLPDKFKVKECYEYWSKFGYKPCGGAWIISDTIKLINALVYDLATCSRVTIEVGMPRVDSDTFFYGGVRPSPSPMPDTTN